MDTEKFYKSFKLAQSQLKYLKEQNIVTNDLDLLVNEDGDFYIKMSSIDIDYIKKHLRGDRFYITTEDDKKEHKTKEYAKSLLNKLEELKIIFKYTELIEDNNGFLYIEKNAFRTFVGAKLFVGYIIFLGK